MMHGRVSRLDHGWIQVGAVRGVPVRLHWTTPAPLLFLALAAGVPLAALGWGALVLLHLAGHLAAVRRAGGRVLAIDLTPVGGECHAEGVSGRRALLAVALAGPAVHLVLGAAAGGALALAGAAFPPPLRAALGFVTAADALLLAVNLLPFPPLDGAEAWRARARDAAGLPERR
jgi:Zn-dependent protease